jgi:hypothetical protein
MTRELGQGRSDLIHEHIRRCKKCQKSAADIQKTLDLLHKASEGDDFLIPKHLSKKHRARIKWAFTHPLLDWIYAHHIMVSVIVALLVLITTIVALKKMNLLKIEDYTGITVHLRGNTENKTPDSENDEP